MSLWPVAIRRRVARQNRSLRRVYREQAWNWRRLICPHIFGGEYIEPDGLFGMSGYPKKVRASKKNACDEQVAARLWEVSVEMTGVDYAALYALTQEKV